MDPSSTDELGFDDNGLENASQQAFWQDIASDDCVIENAVKDSQLSNCDAIPPESGADEPAEIETHQQKLCWKEPSEDEPGENSVGECSRTSRVINAETSSLQYISIENDEKYSQEGTAKTHKLRVPADNAYGRSSIKSEEGETKEPKFRSGRSAKDGGYFNSVTNVEILPSLATFCVTYLSTISLKFSIYLTVGILVLMPSVGVEGELTSIPANMLFVVGQTARMNCSTNLSRPVFWARTLAGSDEEHWLYYGKSGFNGNNADGRFTMDKDEATGRYDVIIADVQPKDAGQYVCVDDSGIGARGSAEIVVSDPISCKSRIPKDGVMGYNVFGLDQDFIQISCSLNYTGNLSPSLKWSWPGSEEESDEPMVSASASAISSTLKLSPTKEQDNAKFQCKAEIEGETQKSVDSGLLWESETVVIKYAEFASEKMDACPGVTWNLVCNPPCEYSFEQKDNDCQCLYTYYDTRTQRDYLIASDAVTCNDNHKPLVALIATVVIMTALLMVATLVLVHCLKMKRRRHAYVQEESCQIHVDDNPSRNMLETFPELPQKSF